MQYNLEKVNECFPKSSTRSKRTLKKLHLCEFSETLASIVLSEAVFDNMNEFELLDIMYEHDNNITVLGDEKSTTLLVIMKTNIFSDEVIKNYCNELLYKLTDVEQKFANIESIDIQYGDAYYGEW